MKKNVILFVFVLILVFPLKGFSQEPDYLWEYQYDVPYVPTPHEVVHEMLKTLPQGHVNVQVGDLLNQAQEIRVSE